MSAGLVWESHVRVVRNRNDALVSGAGLKTAEDVGTRGANLDEGTSGMSYIQVNGFSPPMVGVSPSLPWARQLWAGEQRFEGDNQARDAIRRRYPARTQRPAADADV